MEPPPDAVVAHDTAGLQKLLDDPQGPYAVHLAAGTYVGHVTITRPVRLTASPGTVLDGAGYGTVLTINGIGISVTGLELRNSGRHPVTEDACVKAAGSHNVMQHLRTRGCLFGVAMEQCAQCTLAHSDIGGLPDEPMMGMRGDGIKAWESHGSTIEDNLIRDARDMVVWYSRKMKVLDNEVQGGRYGAHFMYAHDSVAKGNRLLGNVVGIFVMYSNRLRVEDNVMGGARGAAGVGIGFKESEDITLVGNRLVANSVGVYLDRTPRTPGRTLLFRGNTLALNGVGLRFHSSQEPVDFTDNRFLHNAVPLEVDGGGDALASHFQNNEWSDYAGYDLDEDGVGDVPFEIKQLSHAWTDANPVLRLFQGTAALWLVDAMATAMPVFASKLLLHEEHPRMRTGKAVPWNP